MTSRPAGLTLIEKHVWEVLEDSPNLTITQIIAALVDRGQRVTFLSTLTVTDNLECRDLIPVMDQRLISR